MMEAASTSETSVNLYQATRRYNPEDSQVHSRCRENLTSYLKLHIFSLPKIVPKWDLLHLRFYYFAMRFHSQIEVTGSARNN
jgi:hypothetical protein